MAKERVGNYTNITANGNTTVRSGKGVLRSVVVNTKGASANVATLYDNTTNSGTIIGTVDTTTAVGAIIYDVAFSTGLTVALATGTAANLTIVVE